MSAQFEDIFFVIAEILKKVNKIVEIWKNQLTGHKLFGIIVDDDNNSARAHFSHLSPSVVSAATD